MLRLSISNRMKEVAATVTKGYLVADIGCDHAYTSIYMIREGIAKKVIAMDINEGPLARAKDNIKMYGYTDKIETRLSDGAKMLNKGEVNVLVMSGMGGKLVVKILTDSFDTISACDELVIQAQSNLYLVRKYLASINYCIVEEKALKEDNKYYFIIKAKNKKALDVKIDDTIYKEYEYHYGRHLLKNKNEILKEYLKKELIKCERVIKRLEDKKDSIKVSERLEEFLLQKKYIKEGLEQYEM